MNEMGAPGLALFLFGIFCAYWAQNSGRNVLLWFLSGAVLGPIAGLGLLYLNRKDLDRRGMH